MNRRNATKILGAFLVLPSVLASKAALAFEAVSPRADKLPVPVYTYDSRRHVMRGRASDAAVHAMRTYLDR